MQMINPSYSSILQVREQTGSEKCSRKRGDFSMHFPVEKKVWLISLLVRDILGDFLCPFYIVGCLKGDLYLDQTDVNFPV